MVTFLWMPGVPRACQLPGCHRYYITVATECITSFYPNGSLAVMMLALSSDGKSIPAAPHSSNAEGTDN